MSPLFCDEEEGEEDRGIGYSRKLDNYPKTTPRFLFLFDILLPAGRFVAILVILLFGRRHIFNVESFNVVVVLA